MLAQDLGTWRSDAVDWAADYLDEFGREALNAAFKLRRIAEVSGDCDLLEMGSQIVAILSINAGASALSSEPACQT